MKFSSNAVSVDLNFIKKFFDLLFIEFLSIPLKDLLQEYNRFAYQKVFYFIIEIKLLREVMIYQNM